MSFIWDTLIDCQEQIINEFDARGKEIQEEGLHLKEMTNLLLQKIEELTLYTIEQEKRIKALEKEIVEKKQE